MSKVSYGKEANTVYIHFDESDKKVAKTEGDCPFHVDIDDEGHAIGLEIMVVARHHSACASTALTATPA
jgi:uncharacterized protein YuzE